MTFCHFDFQIVIKFEFGSRGSGLEGAEREARVGGDGAAAAEHRHQILKFFLHGESYFRILISLLEYL